MGTIRGIDISFKTIRIPIAASVETETDLTQKCHPPKPIYPWFRSEAAENPDESEDDKNKNRFFNIIIQQ